MARRRQEGNLFFRLDVDFFSDRKVKILKARYGADGITLYLKHYKNRKVIWEMLEGIVPLDQIIDVIIIYNTYRAYKPFTYKELKVKTYDQLRTEVIQ